MRAWTEQEMQHEVEALNNMLTVLRNNTKPTRAGPYHSTIGGELVEAAHHHDGSGLHHLEWTNPNICRLCFDHLLADFVDSKPSEGFAEGMREQEDEGWPKGHPRYGDTSKLCWRLLAGGKKTCINARGHDQGAHEED